MISILEKDLKNTQPNFVKSDLDKYLVDKNQIKEYSKRLWFKGSRYR